MRVKINDTETVFTGETLFELIKSQGLANRTGLAVAVNEIVISRAEWQFHALNQWNMSIHL